MAGHTKGPWVVAMEDDGIDTRPCVLGGSKGLQPVADILGPLDDEDGPHRGHYDALLICAAPDLLAACEAALRHIQPEVEDEEYEERTGAACRLHDALLAAIAKARGE